ncbi:hypothetical protein [Aquidulcibacter sp.]|uniref:hypothetical protein n=1 Tax=Aquidulcibacter sp. TaxID=2052990 RepID=UPI0025C53003|nr:hypothetical protein [Aquidulcibacter sp.]MCA3694190.1 hypothetical protein [Aquidulcibacter sp.]
MNKHHGYSKLILLGVGMEEFSAEAVYEDMRAFVGAKRAISAKFIREETNFGGARVSYSLDETHIQNFAKVLTAELRTNEIYSEDVIYRWRLVNALLVQRRIFGGSLGPHIAIENGEALSTLAAFPLLEFIAQKWTNAWDDNGKAIIDIPEEAGLLGRDGKAKTIKPPMAVSSFYDKMQILALNLDEDHKFALGRFDHLLRRPDIGNGQPAPPLFQRLGHRRNAWAHGQSFNDGEPYILSLLLGFFYIASFAMARTNPTL